MEKETKQIHKYWLKRRELRESITIYGRINRFNDWEADFGKQSDNQLGSFLNGPSKACWDQNHKF